MTSGPTRWELLFADLEARLAAEEAAEREGAVAELTRAEQASVATTDRLRGAVGATLRLELLDGELLDGRLRRVAATWLLLDGHGVRGPGQHLVPLSAVAGVLGAGRHAAPSTARTDGLGLGTALRGLQRDRVRVLVRTRASSVTGRIARVGADHLDLDDVERRGAPPRLVPFSALLRVSEA
ncbi:hypothetical protein [Isoptericola variabilis]|uniref:Uncharacterized protein n=1 Tax=Isoptericola variabilis (strain 225) TaxID=743718 RepID=F6FRK6_ISOV2|nr:hypothetical protein [Isoptericola variabilis]AEG45064.1 hypothetical protein Isova_2347 [Isoptericola variabilis 225]TWH26191.1 hypothetical protein L600_000700000700 [Isoptericola variabilis J7]